MKDPKPIQADELATIYTRVIALAAHRARRDEAAERIITDEIRDLSAAIWHLRVAINLIETVMCALVPDSTNLDVAETLRTAALVWAQTEPGPTS